MILKKPLVKLKVLTSFILAVSLIFFGTAFAFNLISTPAYGAGTANVWNIERSGSNVLDFYYSTSGTNPKALSLTSGGNVGIGATPTTKFDVGPGEIGLGRNSVDPNRYFRIGFTDDNNFQSYITNNASYTGSQWNYVVPGGYGGVATRLLNGFGVFQFDTANNAANPVTWNARLYIANSGSVGIGTTTPVSRLSFGSSLYDTGSKLALYEAAGGTAVFGFGISAGSLDIYSGGVKYMAINQTGKIGFRTGAPTNDLHIKQSSNSYASGGGIKLERSDTGVFGSLMVGADNNLALISNSGAYYCTVISSSPIYCSSDRRLKENILPLGGSALDIIDRLKPSTFNWKSNGAHSAGFIAQEVQEVLPEAVYDGGDMGFALSDGYFTPFLAKGIQELNAQLKNQQSEIDLLKQEIAALKASLAK